MVRVIQLSDLCCFFSIVVFSMDSEFFMVLDLRWIFGLWVFYSSTLLHESARILAIVASAQMMFETLTAFNDPLSVLFKVWSKVHISYF